MRRTKIICTLGPAVESDEMMKILIEAGMNVARCNFSHGDHQEHLGRIKTLRKVAAENRHNVAILLDTRGPEIRTGEFEGNSITLEKGQTVTLTSEVIAGTAEKFTINYPRLAENVTPGIRILLDDGLVQLEVVNVIRAGDVICKVINSGTIKNRRGVNIPGIEVDLPNPTPRDLSDIQFAIDHDLDFIAVSFVQNARTILEIKKYLMQNGGDKIKVISKIENQAGLQNFTSILNASDGIMVARGDLGVELPMEDVPLVQKDLIKKCFMAGKPVITATQMLHSMIHNPRPTRAEVSDIANAIYDLTSAVMLSGETSVGSYPIDCVSAMNKVAVRAENAIDYKGVYLSRLAMNSQDGDVTRAVTHAALTTAYEVGAKAIITCTETGYTAQMLSKTRPSMPIIAITSNEKVCKQLSLNWGVFPITGRSYKTLEEILKECIQLALDSKLIENGDLVVVVAGVPVGIAGATNLIKVEIVGDILVKGVTVQQGDSRARLCLAASTEELKLHFQTGDIVVVRYLDGDMLPLLKDASGLVLEDNDEHSRGEIIGKTLEIPVIKGARAAYDLLKNGSMAYLNGTKGFVMKI
ncbi:MAG: pyruvate kinase [Candidatus Wallbacteria bacterium HGW-Wallbacteria-1]|uniref:Pyruvate kinase n=1 Tax=Candidatus Wallbacteria bacterium HGW-Wallbacteria-1 TaxID=2013854 RepID=A0A2N1PNV6_9BACT|nr:MAG: pyruvate kinase [Candidatus Wallbacteria bacterium HGW-Wallbacteria-1]